MKKTFLLLALFASIKTLAQQNDTEIKKYLDIDTVVITALGKQPVKNIPYQLQRINISSFQKTPRPQLMLQLSQLPSISSITSGTGINKPVIRGLSFNHIQLFANGTRIDNQTWDDRHDIGISDNGFDRAEIISGPAALIYGPNTLGGALVLEETEPGKNEKSNGYARIGFFGNSLGGNIAAGMKGSKNNLYYSVHAAMNAHANYMQGENKEEENQGGPAEEEPLAPNSKFNSLAFKGTLGIRKDRSTHKITYNLYNQNLGIIEDESLDSAVNGGQKEERDYEMEAPYQHVTTHVVSLENIFKAGRSEITFNTGYQYNKRSEFEPGALPKSKFLGVGLNLQTFTADIQWHSDKTKATNITAGIQGFYQNNENEGNFVLVPDAHVSTAGAFIIGHTDYKKLNFLYGIRIDAHQVKMFTTLPKLDDGEEEPENVEAPKQNITRNYTPYSFSAGVVYHPDAKWSLKLNAANGYAAPNYAQLAAYGKHEGTYRFEVGDNSLKMEKNIEVDAGIEYHNSSVTASLNAYSNSISNYIYINPTQDSAGDLKVYRWVQHNAQINGIEANITIHPENLNWFETYIRAGIIRGKLKDNGGDLPYIPANKFITGFTYKKDNCGKWQQLYATIQVGIYNKQNRVSEFEEASDGYFLADIFIGANPALGKMHRWSFTAFCTNLFNKGYFNHLSLIKTIDVREPGRNIGLQVQYRF